MTVDMKPTDSTGVRSEPLYQSGTKLRQAIALSAFGILLVLICFGLGYPTLNRYDPSSIKGLSDSLQYFRLVQYGPDVAEGHFRYRVLVPYLAKPIYWMTRERLGSWNSIAFALLAVNSVFCAGSAFLVSLFAYGMSRKIPLGIIAAFAYLLNFTVSNYQLSGMIDSADAFLFIALTWALLRDRWVFLPAIAVIAGLTKETFVPLATVFALAWLFSEPSVARGKKMLLIILMTIVGVFVVCTVHSAIDHALVLPWNVVSHEHGSGGVGNSLLRVFMGWNLWITMIWLPFVFLAARYIPKRWRVAALAAGVTTLILFVWNDAGPDTTRPLLSGGNVGRPLFDVVGALFAVSFAYTAESLPQGTLTKAASSQR